MIEAVDAFSMNTERRNAKEIWTMFKCLYRSKNPEASEAECIKEFTNCKHSLELSTSTIPGFKGTLPVQANQPLLPNLLPTDTAEIPPMETRENISSCPQPRGTPHRDEGAQSTHSSSH